MLMVLMADQHAARFCGASGHALVRTPHLDELVAGGVLCEQACTTSPICVPARMSFMTGRHIQHTGIWGQWRSVARRHPDVGAPRACHRLPRGADRQDALPRPQQLHGFEA